MPEDDKHFELFVNGQKKRWEQEGISYSQVIALAFPNQVSSQNVDYTVTYTHGPRDHPQGTLTKDQSVDVKSGMRFDVTPTNRS